MSGRIFNKIIFSAVFALLVSFAAGAQTYSGFAPYSIYGIGDLYSQGGAFNKTMGGVGIANRNNRFLNVMNPAAVTARDSLAFMSDFSLIEGNKVFRQGDMSNVKNTFNVDNIAFSFPIYRSSAFMVGIQPYSTTGYKYSFNYDDPSLIGQTGNIVYSADGMGSVYNIYMAAGVTFLKRLSVGAQYNYYFGRIEKNYYEKFSDASYNGVMNGYDIQLRANGAKFGLQYEQPIGGKDKLTLGATYSLKAKLRGYLEGYSYSSGSSVADTLYHYVDTLATRADRLSLADEVGVGISYRHGDKWMLEFDYTRSDWSKSGFDNVPGLRGNTVGNSDYSTYGATVSQAFRLGFELVPNRNDIRYYLKTATYRAGAYYKNEHYLLNGHQVSSLGMTLGVTLPVFRWYNGLTLGVDFGQRGTINDNLIRERYVNFSIGFNIFDIWFQKPQYD